MRLERGFGAQRFFPKDRQANERHDGPRLDGDDNDDDETATGGAAAHERHPMTLRDALAIL